MSHTSHPDDTTTWHLITDSDTIAAQQHTLTTTLRKHLSEHIPCIVSGAGNHYPDEVAYSEQYRVWYSYRQQDNKHLNGFGTQRPQVGKKIALHSEINLATGGNNKAIAAAFATDGHRTALIHRGKIRGGKALFFAHYRGDTLNIDGETYALITVLEDKNSTANICQFVHTIQNIKAAVKYTASPKQP